MYKKYLVKSIFLFVEIFFESISKIQDKILTCTRLHSMSVIMTMMISMGVDPWVDRGTCPPYFLKWRGCPVVCPPYFLGVDIVCNVMHRLHILQFSFACWSRTVLFEELLILF